MTARPQDVALLPCPFCGGTDVGHEYVETYSLDSSYETFGCRSCGAVFVDGSAEEWNRRANLSAALASAQAREDELRAECAHLKVAVLDLEKERSDLIGENERLEEALPQLRSAAKSLRKAEREMQRAIAALSTNAATQTGETT